MCIKYLEASRLLYQLLVFKSSISFQLNYELI